MGNSTFRPETRNAAETTFCPKGGTAYLLIHNAVKGQDGLIHGRLDGAKGEHCAIGSYFAQSPLTALETALVDEIAAVNDSVPWATPKQRKRVVVQWLRWKLAGLGVPGYERWKR